MTFQQHKFFISITIAFLVFWAFLFYDTRAYLSAMSGITNPTFTNNFNKEKAAIADDISNYETCKKLSDTDGRFRSDDARKCILDAMPKTKSFAGTVIFSEITKAWLIDHPADNEVRAAAVQMVNNGWKILDNVNKPINKPIQQINQAWNQSIILSAIKKAKEDNLSEIQADKLKKAEQDLSGPDLFFK